MTTENFIDEYQVAEREQEASEQVKSQFEYIKDFLLDLSLSEDYKQIKRYLEAQTGGCDLETLLKIAGTIQAGLDQVELDAEQRRKSLAYWEQDI